MKSLLKLSALFAITSAAFAACGSTEKSAPVAYTGDASTSGGMGVVAPIATIPTTAGIVDPLFGQNNGIMQQQQMGKMGGGFGKLGGGGFPIQSQVLGNKMGGFNPGIIAPKMGGFGSGIIAGKGGCMGGKLGGSPIQIQQQQGQFPTQQHDLPIYY